MSGRIGGRTSTSAAYEFSPPFPASSAAGLHRTVPSYRIRPMQERAGVGARDQARRIPPDRPAQRRSGTALHSSRLQLGGPLPAHGALRSLHVRSITIDGEAVWCGKDGKSDFDKLHSGAHDASVFLYGFDLIELEGEDLRPAPLEQRKGKLEKLLARSNGIRFSEHLAWDGATIFEHACKLGLEGIVSKRRDLPYRSGRCRAWIKVKNPASPAVLRIVEEGAWE